MAASTSALGWTGEAATVPSEDASVTPAAQPAQPAAPASVGFYIPYRPPADTASESNVVSLAAGLEDGSAPGDDADNENTDEPMEAPPRAASVHDIDPEAQAPHESDGSDSGSYSESEEEDFDPQLYPSITTGSSRHVPPAPRAFSDADSEESSASGDSGSEYAAEEHTASPAVQTYVTKTGRIKIKKAPTRASARIRVSPGAPTDIVPLAVRTKAAVPPGSSRGHAQATEENKASTSTDSPRTRSTQSPSSSTNVQPIASTAAPYGFTPTGRIRKPGKKARAALMAAEAAAAGGSTGIQGWDGPAPAPPKTGIKKVTLSLKNIAPASARKDGAGGSADSGKHLKRLPRKRRFKTGATSAEIITAEMDEESEVEAATVNDKAAAAAAAGGGEAEKAARKGAAVKDKSDHPRKKRKTSDGDGSARRSSIAKTPKGTRPPPLNVLDKKEPIGPRPDRGLISPVVTGFPIHTADGDTLDSLRTAWRIKEQQRQLINARKNGENTPAMSPGMGPPASGQTVGQPAPVSADGHQVLPPVSANGSVGQRRGDVAREKVNNLRLNTAGGDPSQAHPLAMRSAPIAQMPLGPETGQMTGSVNGFVPHEQFEGERDQMGMPDQHTVQPLQTQPVHPGAINRQSSVNAQAGPSGQQNRQDQRNGAMTAYPSLGSQPQYQQQQQQHGMPPPTSTASSRSQVTAQNGRRASAHSLSTTASGGQMHPPSSTRGDKSSAGPLLTHAPFTGSGMASSSHKDSVVQPLQVQPLRPAGIASYAPGDPTPMQAHFGPGRSPPSSSIRRDFGPTGRDWHPPQTGGLHAPQAGPSQQRLTSNGDVSGLPGGARQYQGAAGVPDAHRSAFMEPFNLFYDALMDSNQLRSELQAKVAKATELIAAQEHELARIRAVREEYEASVADMAARDAGMDALKRKVAALENGTVDDGTSESSGSDGSGEADEPMT